MYCSCFGLGRSGKGVSCIVQCLRQEDVDGRLLVEPCVAFLRVHLSTGFELMDGDRDRFSATTEDQGLETDS